MNLIRHIKRGTQFVWTRFIPNPVDVFSYDLDVHVTAAQIEEMAHRFTKKYSRDYLDDFKVHDACHYLLGAPPTPWGEGLVVRFQMQHMIYDNDFFGGGIAVVIASRIIALSPSATKTLDRRIEQLLLGFQQKIDQLKDNQENPT